MKKIITLLVYAVAAITLNATDYTIFPDANVASYALPIAYINESHAGSITQQIYWAEELTDQGATSGNINSITFYYTAAAGTTAAAYSRDIQIYLMEVDNTTDVYSITKPSYDWVSHFLYDGTTKKAGTKVYDGKLTTESVTSSNPINLSTDVKTITVPITVFSWHSTKNIVMTIADVTNTVVSSTNLRFLIASTKVSSTSYPRFAYTKWTSVPSPDSRLGWIDDFSGDTKWSDKYGYTTTTYNTEDGQKSQRSYVNKVTFSISTPVPAPTSPSSSDITSSSATIGWTAAAGAESYEIRYGTTSGSLGAATNIGNVVSYNISELEDETTYYYQIRTKIGSNYSAWTAEASFTTLAEAAHTHNGITFEKWNSTNSLPTSGNYYLDNDVVLGAIVTLTGNLNLCLNGHEVYTETYCIKTSNYTLAIYDNVGGGRIYGYFVADYPNYGIINVEIGGTLVMGEGVVENLYGTDPSDSPNLSYAIYNFGTLKLSGTPTISGVDGDIYLGIGKVITIESGKPLTNTTPYSVYKSGAGAITSGWANMSGADPEDYFVSANSSLAVYDNGSEAALRTVINIRDNADNSSTIHEKAGQTLNVSLTRTWAADGYYSTLCLPFDLSSAQVSSIFGAGTELATLSSSSIDEETIYLVFESASSIEAGKPYLINPVNDVVNPQIAGVTIAEDLHDITTTYVDFKGIFSPTALAASENILCLGGSNSLGWPSAAGNLNGMRAYFEIHSLPAGAPALRHARFVAPGQHIPAAIDDAQDQEGRIEKVIEDGQVIIIRDGKKYNVLGINK